MSNFQCEQCGKMLYDTPKGYETGCEHYPQDVTRCPNCGDLHRDLASGYCVTCQAKLAGIGLATVVRQ